MPKAKADPALTLASIEKNRAFQEVLKKRILDVAESYFRITHGTSLWRCDELVIVDDLRPYAGSTVMVHAKNDREIEDTVNVPIEMVVARNWEDRVHAWALETRRRADRSLKHRELFRAKELFKKYPLEVRMIVDGKEPEL